MATFYPSMLNTLRWADDNKKQYQIVKTQTDEDGNFSASLVAGKKYHVYARGRAGANEAFWDGDLVTIQPGARVVMKLSSPETSCLDVAE